MQNAVQYWNGTYGIYLIQLWNVHKPFARTVSWKDKLSLFNWKTSIVPFRRKLSFSALTSIPEGVVSNFTYLKNLYVKRLYTNWYIYIYIVCHKKNTNSGDKQGKPTHFYYKRDVSYAKQRTFSKVTRTIY